MAIRLRTVNGTRVALCAAETDPRPGDVYLDDAEHYALAAKFSRDWQGHPPVEYPAEWAAMDTQKLRDAREELEKWFERLEERCARCGWLRVHHSGEGRGRAACVVSDSNGGFASYHATKTFHSGRNK